MTRTTSDRSQRKRQTLLADPRRIKQIAHDQQHVGALVVGDVDNLAERPANPVAQLHPALARSERVGLEVNVRRVNQLERPMRMFSWQIWSLGRFAGQFRSMTTCYRVKIY